ncbi:STAS domain-containing protein [Amycolatopsis sp. NPDC098790]|uniref:STAS domain-containing protein n=1 Tax=Amycolatopsis sp. NPDC098790 TaxID=3363939 RepID=UPI003816AD20
MKVPRPRNPALRLRATWPAPHAVRITARGAIDTTTAADLATLVSDRLRAAPDRLVLDLSEVDFLGVAGIRVLLRAALQASQNGTELVVEAGTNSLVRRALRVTGADRRLAISIGRPEPAPA